jgi:hypothetical protein
LTHACGARSGQPSYQDAVTSEDRLSIKLVQCAAATRDTHQVFYSSDEKMSSNYSKGAMREVEEAGFAM